MTERAKNEGLDVVFSGVVNDDKDEPTPATMYHYHLEYLTNSWAVIWVLEYEEADWWIVGHICTELEYDNIPWWQ